MTRGLRLHFPEFLFENHFSFFILLVLASVTWRQKICSLTHYFPLPSRKGKVDFEFKFMGKRVSKSVRTFNRCEAPRRHSGESSLSPKDPSNSEMTMSKMGPGRQSRMSELITSTWFDHSFSFRRWIMYTADGFFSTAYNFI